MRLILLISFVFTSLLLSAQTEHLWTKSYGGSDWDYGTGVALDLEGNIYTVGRFASTVDFDPGSGVSNLMANGATDIYVQKLDVQGDFLWAKAIGGPGEDVAFALGVDINGNVYLTGNFLATVDVDPGTGVANLMANGGRDMFLVKYTPELQLIWGLNAGGSGNDYGRSLGVEKATGTAYVAASQYSSDVANWGTEECFNEVPGLPGTNEVLVLASYDKNGNPLCVIDLQTQQQGYYSAGYQSQMHIRNGALYYLANYSSNSTDFDPGVTAVTPTFNGGAWDVALTKYELSPFSVNLGGDFGFCNNTVVELDATSENATYFWQDGSSESTFTVDAAGTYSVLVNSSGCVAKDEVIGTEDQINANVSLAGNVLTAELANAEYQWINCPDFTPIPGANNQIFEATEDGDYAVMISSNGCIETSACLSVMVSNLEDISWKAFSIFPNPIGVAQLLHLEFQQVHQDIHLQIFSIDGRLLESHTETHTNRLVLPFNLPSGAYLIKLRVDGYTGQRRIVCSS